MARNVTRDLQQKSDSQRENEKSLSLINEHSATVYGQIGFNSQPSDDLFDDGGHQVTTAHSGTCYNVSSFTTMNATRVKVLETFNLSNDHCTLNFGNLEDRLVTLMQWEGPLDYQSMAEAGFVYCGQEDLVFCFHCNIKLDRWSKDMEPLLRHKEESPTCSFMRQRLQAVKGERGKTKSVVAPSKPLNSRLTSSIGQLQSSSLVTSKSIHTVVTGLNEPRLSYGGSFDDRPGASLPITPENTYQSTRVKMKAGPAEILSNFEEVDRQQDLPVVNTNTVSISQEHFCTTKPHQQADHCFSTAVEIFKSVNDSICTGSKSLEQFMVMCVCFCIDNNCMLLLSIL